MFEKEDGVSSTSKSSIFHSKKAAPWIFLTPFLIIFFIFKLWPIIFAGILSLNDVTRITEKVFVGFKNYQRLFTDEAFFKALINNTLYMLGTMVTLIPIPLFLAMVLDSKFCLMKNTYKAILFIPTVTSLVVAAAVFRLLLSENGLVNVLLEVMQIPQPGWLTKANWAIPSVLIVASWRWMGMNIVYFLTGLTGIPRELYEQADIDGASYFRRFFSITLPLLKPIVLFVVTLNIIGGYKLFAEPYVLWNSGATPNQGALTLALYLFRTGFSYLELGYASSIGFVMALIILILSLIQFKAFGMFKE